jgi:hypothetical protein
MDISMLAERPTLGKRGDPTLSDPFPIRHMSVTKSDDFPAAARLRGFPGRYFSYQILRAPPRLRVPRWVAAQGADNGGWIHRTEEEVSP